VLSSGGKHSTRPLEKPLVAHPLVEQLDLVGRTVARLAALDGGPEQRASPEVACVHSKESSTGCLAARHGFRFRMNGSVGSLLVEPVRRSRTGCSTGPSKQRRDRIASRDAEAIRVAYRQLTP